MDKNILTVNDLIKILPFSRNQIHKLAVKGILPCSQPVPKGKRYFKREHIEIFINKHGNKAFREYENLPT